MGSQGQAGLTEGFAGPHKALGFTDMQQKPLGPQSRLARDSFVLQFPRQPRPPQLCHLPAQKRQGVRWCHLAGLPPSMPESPYSGGGSPEWPLTFPDSPGRPSLRQTSVNQS